MVIWAPMQPPLLLLDKKTSQDDFQQTGPVSSNKAWQQLSDTLMHALSTLSPSDKTSPQIVYPDKSSLRSPCRRHKEIFDVETPGMLRSQVAMGVWESNEGPVLAFSLLEDL